MKIDKLIINKIILPRNNNYTAIIGTSPSKTARSPTLWNKVYKCSKAKQRWFQM